MNFYEIITLVAKVISTALAVLLFYKHFYKVVGFFTTRKFKSTQNKHKYAVVIAARNEEDVIGNLIDSINKQDYDKNLVTVFVVADNCTDNTALVAEKNGAICYKRSDNKNRTKGFALKYLFQCIERDFGTQSFDGFFVFDADNLLSSDYISRMNEAFDSGEKIITSYRGTKNFKDGWIAASYAIHWLKCCLVNHRPRSIFRLATNLQGTGFLFASELVKSGWKYTSFTEDRAFSADAVKNGYNISYCEAAKFYDEQPTSLKIALRQRLRWSKGHILAFLESAAGLFVGIFKQRRFACYDMLSQITPTPILKFFVKITVFISGLFYYTLYSGATLQKTVFGIFKLQTPQNNALFTILLLFLFLIYDFIIDYLKETIMAIYVLFMERKELQKIGFFKRIWYIFMWPWFNIIGRITLVLAMFLKVEWKPIPHKSKTTIEDIKE